MKVLHYLIIGTYDALANEEGEISTEFTICEPKDATHVSVYAVGLEELEPVKDFPISRGNAADEASKLALRLGKEHNVPVVNHFDFVEKA